MHKLVWLAALSLLVGCGHSSATPEPSVPALPSLSDSNPFASVSPLAYQAPDFSRIDDRHFAPAFDAGMAAQRAEIAAILGNPEPASFENTVLALELSGELLRRSRRVFNHLVAVESQAQRQALKAEYALRFSEHNDAIYQDRALFARLDSLMVPSQGWQREDRRLLEQTHQRFVRTGARLNEAEQARVRELNGEIAQLTNQFGEHLLAATEAAAVWVDDVACLAGASERQIRAAARAAQEAGQPGRYLLRLSSTTRQPLLSQLDNRALRAQLWRASAQRGSEAPFDNRQVILSLMALRSEKAALLGYQSWAEYRLDKQMAQTPTAAAALLSSMVPQVRANTEREAQQLRQQIALDGGDHELQPWDWFYYAERLRRERYQYDSDELSQYLEFDRVLEQGVFFTMTQLFGVRFERRTDLPVYHPDVRVYEVIDHDERPLGLFYGDYFARPGKRGGAWMANLVHQSHQQGSRPVVLNVANLQRAADGEPQLLTLREVKTLFHEMGHALHGLLSDVRYRSLSGTAVSRDFAEFPSKFQEDWRFHPEVIGRYARHHQTGTPIPSALLQRAVAAERFNQGFDTLEYLAAALLDLEWHSLTADHGVTDVAGFEAEVLSRHGVALPFVPPRYGSTYFGHVFARGYSATYYAYLWSEILAADAFAHVQAQGGLSRSQGEAFRRAILSQGNTDELMTLYRNFRGKAPDTQALLRRRGIVL
ncbi:M3 family metallopeptidase [Ferrimonas pelagia]|uniref:M3 family metallopeptidase n=1 Tax=Ferrimonas pelagia TaxID=1177826 RepID=A0ABP9F635_9GAMM